MRGAMTALLAGGIIAAPVMAAQTPEAALARLLGDRRPGAVLRCIRPDLSAQPEIFDAAAIVYRDARRTYVNRLDGACPQLRRGRRIIVTGAGGQLCVNDPVRVVDTTGAGFGFCTLGPFVPYER